MRAYRLLVGIGAIVSAMAMGVDAGCGPCDTSFPPNPSNPAVIFCGTDGQTHETSMNAVTCYRNTCQIEVFYPFSCQCPNNCSGGLHGSCDSGTVCVCNEGWGGADCNTVQCPANTCAGHGTCDATKNMCLCDEGWGGPDCNVTALAVNDQPWGCAVPPQYVTDGTCGQPAHQIPWYDFVGLPQVHLEMDEQDLRTMIRYADDPVQSEIKRTVNVTWTSTVQHKQAQFENAKVKLKGSASKANAKKSFSVFFDGSTSPTGDNWPKKLAFKASSNIIADQLIVSLLMAMGSPIARSNLGLLFVNGRYYGVFNMFGDFTHGFIDYWYGKGASDDGVFYKAGGGTRPFEKCGPNFDPKPGQDYCDIVNWFHNPNVTQAEFDEGLPKRIDVDGLARALAIASFIMLGDGFVQGNNYQYFTSNSTDPAKPHWSLSLRDFDKFWQDSHNFVDVMTWAIRDDVVFGVPLMQDAQFVTLFKQHFEQLLGALSDKRPTGSPSIGDWLKSFVPLLDQWMDLDMWVDLTAGMRRNQNVASLAVKDAAELEKRIPVVKAQLATTPTPPQGLNIQRPPPKSHHRK